MESGRPCPRCGSSLHVQQAPDVTLLACARCLGLWLDNRGCQLLVGGALSEAARDIIRDIDARASPQAPPRRADYRAPAQASGADDALPCPVCRAPLSTHITDEVHVGVAVRLDVCTSHGTWFDRGEAWTLLQAVQLRRLEVDVALDADAAEQRWRARERTWAGVVASSVRSRWANPRWRS